MKTPFKGYHPFCVFVIFPVHVVPWSLLCKGMVDRKDSRFQPNTVFSCTGKVAGLLDHRLMTQPPLLPQDYVFIVVPDTWTFHEKTIRVSTTPEKQSSIDPFGKSRFLSPSKRVQNPPSTPAPTPTPSAQAAGQPISGATILPFSSSKESQSDSLVPSKRPIDQDTSTPSLSSKKARTASQVPNAALHHDVSNDASNNASNSKYPEPYPSQPVDSTANSNLVSYSVPTTLLPTDETRPHRVRQVPKKYSITD
jgi:hypothetical protein